MTFLTFSYWVQYLNHINSQWPVTPIFQSITVSASRGKHSFKGFSIIAFRISFKTIPASSGGAVTCWRFLDIIRCQWNVFRHHQELTFLPEMSTYTTSKTTKLTCICKDNVMPTAKMLKCKRKRKVILQLMERWSPLACCRETHNTWGLGTTTKTGVVKGQKANSALSLALQVHKLYGLAGSVRLQAKSFSLPSVSVCVWKKPYRQLPLIQCIFAAHLICENSAMPGQECGIWTCAVTATGFLGTEVLWIILRFSSCSSHFPT